MYSRNGRVSIARWFPESCYLRVLQVSIDEAHSQQRTLEFAVMDGFPSRPPNSPHL